MKRLRETDDTLHLPYQKATKSGEAGVRLDATATKDTKTDIWQHMINDFRLYFSDEYA